MVRWQNSKMERANKIYAIYINSFDIFFSLHSSDTSCLSLFLTCFWLFKRILQLLWSYHILYLTICIRCPQSSLCNHPSNFLSLDSLNLYVIKYTNKQKQNIRSNKTKRIFLSIFKYTNKKNFFYHSIICFSSLSVCFFCNLSL